MTFFWLKNTSACRLRIHSFLNIYLQFIRSCREFCSVPVVAQCCKCTLCTNYNVLWMNELCCQPSRLILCLEMFYDHLSLFSFINNLTISIHSTTNKLRQIFTLSGMTRNPLLYAQIIDLLRFCDVLVTRPLYNLYAHALKLPGHTGSTEKSWLRNGNDRRS